MRKLYTHIILSSLPCLILCFVFIRSSSTASDDTDSLYGPTQEEKYLRGRFEPEKHPFFAKLSDFGIPCDRPQYLRKEAASALKKMYEALKKDIPDVKFWVQSSTRNWNSQKAIWERRWKEFSKKSKNEKKIAQSILRSSSMPGTSRHHWGTDFDINVLKNNYYAKGDGAKLYNWLKQHAAEFGFCQPYTAGRTSGYMEERWHWSYIPMASKFHKRWNALFGENAMALVHDGGFIGHKGIIDAAPIYVNAIDDTCAQNDVTE